MKKKLAVFLTVLLAAVSFVHADEMDAIRQRVKSRSARINYLFMKGSIGLNSKSYLEAREKIKTIDQSLLKAENDDRKKIFEKVAKDSGVALHVVEKRSQPKFVARLPRKAWYQDAARGKWVQK